MSTFINSEISPQGRDMASHSQPEGSDASVNPGHDNPGQHVQGHHDPSRGRGKTIPEGYVFDTTAESGEEGEEGESDTASSGSSTERPPKRKKIPVSQPEPVTSGDLFPSVPEQGDQSLLGPPNKLELQEWQSFVQAVDVIIPITSLQ